MNTLPTAYRNLLSSVTDTYTVIAEHPRHDSLRSSVWEIEGPDGKRWFAKQNAGPKLHRREVDAYLHWITALGPDRAPTLAASDAATRTLLVTAVPGKSLDKLRLPAEQEQEAYRQAGLLLARLHAATSPSCSAEETADLAVTLEKLLANAERYLTADDTAVLRALAKQAPPALSTVTAHWDYMPKNWMWDEREQRLRVIDFERTQREPAVRRDLSRLYYRVLYHRPDLAAAFSDGYARPLTASEEQARAAYAAQDALDGILWGAAHHAVDLADEAHMMIANLRAEHTRRTIGR
ncbi:phosphotransferase [Streptomyces sp. MNP-20]|uniref:aminoglycoside phosphotransferase family protein n=1 Tax=Streptomyces sp. MNP-20 TaxID=2721165 RepID=UPI001553641E|nr:phosphotransferase [Streptomyces sp. MNP-20]